jgi:hypothetical protein
MYLHWVDQIKVNDLVCWCYSLLNGRSLENDFSFRDVSESSDGRVGTFF